MAYIQTLTYSNNNDERAKRRNERKLFAFDDWKMMSMNAASGLCLEDNKRIYDFWYRFERWADTELSCSISAFKRFSQRIIFFHFSSLALSIHLLRSIFRLWSSETYSVFLSLLSLSHLLSFSLQSSHHNLIRIFSRTHSLSPWLQLLLLVCGGLKHQFLDGLLRQNPVEQKTFNKRKDFNILKQIQFV